MRGSSPLSRMNTTCSCAIRIFQSVLKAEPCNSSFPRNFPRKDSPSTSSFPMKANRPSPSWMTMKYFSTEDYLCGFIGNRVSTRSRPLLRLNWCKKCAYRIRLSLPGISRNSLTASGLRYRFPTCTTMRNSLRKCSRSLFRLHSTPSSTSMRKARC